MSRVFWRDIAVAKASRERRWIDGARLTIARPHIRKRIKSVGVLYGQ
jgi:hypothetical protein